MSKNPKWVEELQTRDKLSAKRLNNILLELQRHKGVYSLAEDPAIAQLWFALVEVSRRQEGLEEKFRGKDAKHSAKSKEPQKKRSEILEALQNY